MIVVELSKQSLTFLRKIPRKDAQILGGKIQVLSENPQNIPSKALQGHKPLRRIRVGSYRVIYYIEDNILYISFIGKRNDDEIYRVLKRRK